MDLLGSIIDAMSKPPATNEEERNLKQQEKDAQQYWKSKKEEELTRFRKYVEERLGRFARDDRTFLEFQPFDKTHCKIIKKMAEYGGFMCLSFGSEDVDRYSVIYKKEYEPTSDEIAARRNGEKWNEHTAKEYAERRRKQEELELKENEQKLVRVSAELAGNLSAVAVDQRPSNNLSAVAVDQRPSSSSRNQTKNKVSGREGDQKPTYNYRDKYAHIFGKVAAVEAVKKTEANACYGFVPSKNKRDVRTIEETLADIQAKKRLKLQQKQREEVEQPQESTTSS